MQGIRAVMEPTLVNQAPSPSRSNSIVSVSPCFKLPLKVVQTAGIALATSTVLLLTPVDASAAPSLSYAPPTVKQSLEARDKAMEFQCKGGMFDCDSDRRDFAKNQYKEFVKRNGGIVPEKDEKPETSSENTTTAPAASSSSSI